MHVVSRTQISAAALSFNAPAIVPAKLSKASPRMGLEEIDFDQKPWTTGEISDIDRRLNALQVGT